MRQKYFLFLLAACVVNITLHAQIYPGGVSGNISIWLKANVSVPVNMTVNAGNAVSGWTNELPAVNAGYSVTQATASRQPVLIDVPADTADFNFNPSLQFAVSAQRTLANTNTSPNILGASGTVFLVVNTYTYPGGGTSSTCLAYTSDNNARYQIKPDFRVQTGINGMGQTADFNLSANGGMPSKAGRIVVSRSVGGGFTARRNGTVTPINNAATAMYYPSVGLGLCVGANSNFGNTEYSNSAIAEIITYNATLSTADVNKVETYLAVKYGATLDQSAGVDYTASNGAVIWNAAANNGYGMNITGIGRDDLSGLSQKQSRSVNTAGLVYVYNGITGGTFSGMNAENTSVFASDNSFLLFGDNGGDTALNICVQENAGLRMSRVWKVQKTGGIGAVTLAVNNTEVPAGVQSLLVSADASFPEGATFAYSLSDNGVRKYADLIIPDGAYFTFATDSARLSVTGNTPVCEGDDITVRLTGAPGGSDISWFGPGGFTSTGSDFTVPDAGVNRSGMYTAIVTRNGCVMLPLKIAVAVHPRPEAAFDVEVIRGCAADTIAAHNRSTLFIDYAWDFGDGTGSLLQDPRHGYGKAGNYQITLVAIDGHCTDTAVQDVTIAPLGEPQLRFDAVTDIRCAGDRTGAFEVAVEKNGASPYRYSVNGGAAVNYKNFNRLPAGRYVVTVTDQNDCSGTDTVVLNEPERLRVFISDVQDDYCSKGPLSGSVDIEMAGGVEPYALSLNGEPYADFPQVTGLKYGDYNVVVTDAHECTATSFFEVKEVECCVMRVPNAFSPNGDGRNDMLRPVNNGIRLVSFEVYNRWGQQLFTTKNMDRGWDGTYRGVLQDVATYFYTITYFCLETGMTLQEKGDVMIVR